MIRVTYVEHDGTAHDVDAAEGLSLMEAAKQQGVPGIAADCGGSCACATCHVHVDPDWFGAVGPAEEDEADLLQFANDPGETSRLSCQVRLRAELDGLVVRLPASQH
jgi:2Fe-2S ferredoxin